MNSPVVRCLAAALLCATAACTTVGPDYRVPDNAIVKRDDAGGPLTGVEARTAQAAPLPDHWWRLYDDPVLDDLVEQAFAANTNLRVAEANLEHSAALVQQAYTLRNPTVGISAAPMYGLVSAVSLGLAARVPTTGMYDAGISIGYQLDLFGKIKRVIEEAHADHEATEAAYDLVRVNVAANTVQAYANICTAGEELRVAQRSIDLQQQFVALTQQRINAGRGTTVDIERARGLLEQLRAAVPPLQAQRTTSQYRLAVLLGKVPGSLPASLGQCDRPPLLRSPIPVGDGAALLRRRPDVRQAERTLAAATARIGVATGELYPTINLGTSFGSTGLLSEFGANNATRWSIGPLISWTLPSNGVARAHIAQAEAGTKAALARFDGVVLDALNETSSALAIYARDLDRVDALTAARDQNRKAAEDTRTLYRLGRVDQLSALDAERTLAASESTLTAAQSRLSSDQVALFMALGGGWERDPAPAGQQAPSEKTAGAQPARERTPGKN